MTQEQFIQSLFNYWSATNQVMWELWDVKWEWERYKKGRSWCNEFFNNEGAKYVASN